MEKCNNCAWYCHSNGMCYGNALLPTGTEIGLPMEEKHEACESWSFDGLQEWEREACKPDALVTMGENQRVYEVPVINMQAGIPVIRMQKVVA